MARARESLTLAARLTDIVRITLDDGLRIGIFGHIIGNLLDFVVVLGFYGRLARGELDVSAVMTTGSTLAASWAWGLGLSNVFLHRPA